MVPFGGSLGGAARATPANGPRTTEKNVDPSQRNWVFRGGVFGPAGPTQILPEFFFFGQNSYFWPKIPVVLARFGPIWPKFFSGEIFGPLLRADQNPLCGSSSKNEGGLGGVGRSSLGPGGRNGVLQHTLSTKHIKDSFFLSEPC